MATVALVGYSCSGKTEVAKAIRKQLTTVIIRDSDKEIAKSLGDGSIASVYMKREREEALREIEQSEGSFLDSIATSASPQLIVCGPNVVIRDLEWQEFAARVKPVFYYLKIEPKACYNRLLRRDESYSKKYFGPRAGSWNAGILRDFKDGRWQLKDRQLAIESMPSYMARQQAEYNRIASASRTYQCRDILKGSPGFKALIEAIIVDLNHQVS